MVLVLLCVPAAIALNCEAATYNRGVSVTSGDAHVTSKSTAQATMHDGKVSAVTSTITIARVNKETFTVSL